MLPPIDLSFTVLQCYRRNPPCTEIVTLAYHHISRKIRNVEFHCQYIQDVLNPSNWYKWMWNASYVVITTNIMFGLDVQNEILARRTVIPGIEACPWEAVHRAIDRSPQQSCYLLYHLWQLYRVMPSRSSMSTCLSFRPPFEFPSPPPSYKRHWCFCRLCLPSSAGG